MIGKSERTTALIEYVCRLQSVHVKRPIYSSFNYSSTPPVLSVPVFLPQTTHLGEGVIDSRGKGSGGLLLEIIIDSQKIIIYSVFNVLFLITSQICELVFRTKFLPSFME